MRVRYVILAAAMAASLAACGGSGDSGDSTSADPTTDAAAETMTSAAADDAGDDASDDSGDEQGESLSIADSSLGPILVDDEGLTMYLFTNDSPGTSTCADQCLVNWPPLPGPATAGDGIDASLLGTTTATDGTTQATYNGWPLYYFVNDAAAGDVNGQGVNDVWFAIDAAGNAVGN